MSMKKPRKRMGRPPIITPEVVRQVSELMAKGVPEEFACALVGVNPETYGPAVCRSPKLKEIARLYHARFISESMDIIKSGSVAAAWTGRAWILERRYKPHFNKTEVVKDGEGPKEGGGLVMSAEDMELLEKTMKKEILGKKNHPSLMEEKK